MHLDASEYSDSVWISAPTTTQPGDIISILPNYAPANMESFPRQSGTAEGGREQIDKILEEIDTIKATSTKSAEKLRGIMRLVGRHPEYFTNETELAGEFQTRVEEKIGELQDGPELIRKKQDFWARWKNVSMGVAAGGGLLALSGVFPETAYLNEMFHTYANVSIAGGLLTGYFAIGSAGAAKITEIIADHKASELSEELRRNKLSSI